MPKIYYKGDKTKQMDIMDSDLGYWRGQGWDIDQPTTPTPQAPQKPQAPPAYDLPYRSGLNEQQRESIQTLIKTGRKFSETDARNFAFAINQPNYKAYVGKTGQEAMGLKPGDVGVQTFTGGEQQTIDAGQLAQDGELTETSFPDELSESNKVFVDTVKGFNNNIQKVIADLIAKQKQQIEDLKAGAKEEQERLKKQVGDLTTATPFQDKLKELQAENKIQAKIDNLTSIGIKITNLESGFTSAFDAQTTRPGITTAIAGKQQQLFNRYKAEMATLTGIAAVYQEDLNLANKLITQGIDALTADNTQQISALNTLLELNNNNLLQLDADEKELFEAQINILQTEADRLREDGLVVAELIMNNPEAAEKSGVTIADTIQQAVEKMKPYLAKYAQTARELAEAKEDISGVTPTGQIVSDASGSSYDIGSYATDPNHEEAIQSILDSMGQMTSVSQMDEYIQSIAPGSPITGQMVANASEKYGVSWETLMAIMQHESGFGTSPVATKNNNVGGMTWTGTNGEQGTARPSDEGGYYVRYHSFPEGVDAVAKSLAWRKTNGDLSEYMSNYEFGYSEKVDVNRLPDLGGKQITNKTARGANLPYGITDKQADWIQMRRPGSIAFQSLKTKDYDSLIALIELKDDIAEIRRMKENVNTGWATTKSKRARRFLGVETDDINAFSALEQKTGKELANYIKSISGAAVSEQEAQRLKKNIPNVEMQDKQFNLSLDDYEDDFNAVIQGKLEQYDFENEEEFRNAIMGGSYSTAPDELSDDEAYQEYLELNK